MTVTVLGCGDAFGSKGRYNTSFLLANGSEKLLVDCGATSLVRLKQLGVAIDEIHTIIITHFHGDHYGGIPFLILSRHFEYEHQPLTLIGPSGLKEKLYTLQEVLYPGTSEFYEALNVEFIEYEPKKWIEHNALSVYSREVVHSPLSIPHGIKLKWKDKAFGYSGDTSWSDALVDLASGTDLFVLECNNLDVQTPGHLSYKEIMTHLSKFDTTKLCLTHMSSEVLEQEHLQLERLEDGQVINL